MLVKSKFFDNFIMFCVIMNTVILALDGIVDTKSNTLLSNLNLIFTIVFGNFFFRNLIC